MGSRVGLHEHRIGTKPLTTAQGPGPHRHRAEETCLILLYSVRKKYESYLFPGNGYAPWPVVLDLVKYEHHGGGNGVRELIKRQIPGPLTQKLHSSRADRTPGICFWHVWIRWSGGNWSEKCRWVVGMFLDLGETIGFLGDQVQYQKPGEVKWLYKAKEVKCMAGEESRVWILVKGARRDQKQQIVLENRWLRWWEYCLPGDESHFQGLLTV